ncbi:hypothetical protein [Thiolapillus sp.]
MNQIHARAGSCLALFLIFSGAVVGAGYKSFTRSVVVFNTVCAKCHEAQCSGRLSFDEDFEVSSSHVVRHYDGAAGNKQLQKELFTILNYMKANCAYYPVQQHIPPQRIWYGEKLDSQATPEEKYYFVPVGSLDQGAYRLELSLAENTKATLQIVSGTFDMMVEDCYESREQRIVVPFQVEEPGEYYVRIYPRKPVRIVRLAIARQKKDAIPAR